ncbi:MAG TPA: alkaline phosphatase family protein, partial [Candidatus Tumulicola sp.]|nr:alkaline phosphatase family protein [Candidatus Tumulicola sp.]
RMKYRLFACAAAAIALATCSGPRQNDSALPGDVASGRSALLRPGQSASPIKHIVIIVQENRTPDYLFHFIKGADIADSGLDSEGQTVQLQPESLASNWDLLHGNGAFNTDYDGGKMDGWDKKLAPRYHTRPFGYAPENEVKPYLQMAHEYVLADKMFQTNQSGSFPAHEYLVSGDSSAEPVTSDEVSSNGQNHNVQHKNAPVGCDAPQRSFVYTIDKTTGQPGPTPFPCFDRPALSDLLDAAGVSWKFYEHDLGPGIWHSFDAISHVRYGPDYVNVITPSQQVLTDIKNGKLAGLSWVMPPSDAYSDHAGSNSAKGPSWVSAVVNAVGNSKYWNSTAILIVWDDWGGWYDHVPPQLFNHYELGFRVPLLVVSPYAKKNYVSHVQYEFGSLLKFAETTFNLGSLGTTDARANDLTDAFHFGQSPRAFVTIKAPPFVPSRDTMPGSPNVEDP